MTVALVSASARMWGTPDGRLWTRSHSGYHFWERYLGAYDEVLLVLRALPVVSPPDGAVEATGEGVVGRAVPDFSSPLHLPVVWRRLAGVVDAALERCDAVHVRLPSVLGPVVAAHARRRNKPVGVEVVGHGYLGYADGGRASISRRFAAMGVHVATKWTCKRAAGVAYVTERALQQVYPPAKGAVVGSFSSVELHPSDFGPSARAGDAPAAPARTDVRLIAVGSMARPYKGFLDLIEAVALLREHGVDARLTIVGDGKERAGLERHADLLGLRSVVDFVGQVPYPVGVRTHLDEADIFVVPSLTEGLPRSLLEAMARGLPCVGTRVGGIPEVLDPVCLAEPGNGGSIASRLRALIGDPRLRAAQAIRNRRVAERFADEALEPRRTSFYRAVQRA